ncbi:hypothetical protein PybrP1_011614, partial [[Pythium] brassicae (nom. inval.)]
MAFRAGAQPTGARYETARLLHGASDTDAAPATEPSLASSRRWLPQLSAQGVIVLLCTINLLNYVDRGIIPGSPQRFQDFISDTLHVDATQQSFYLGILASSFVASYSYTESYYVLLFGRVLSGVGEASFQCNATPFIDTHAPKASRALAAFFIEGALMVVLVLACLLVVPPELDVVPDDRSHDKRAKHSGGVEVPTNDSAALLEHKLAPRRSFVAEWWTIFSNPTFALVVLGHAAYTFSLAALSVFSP